MSSILEPLQSFLTCLLQYAVGAVVAGVTLLANGLIAGLFLVLGPLLALLPEADLDSLSLPPYLAWANWALPLDHFVAAFGVIATVLVVWMVVGTGLRWLKVVE